nr:ribonuclease H-like domain-containing protein [Tanacetum cinerariifolium]
MFGGNEATKKTKKNLLKQQYGNFKAEGSETLEQKFNRLQVIVGQLQFIDVEIDQDDLNQKFLTSLAPEWLMHTIVWRNRSDLDTMSLDDLYNHLKVYESKVQKKSKPNSQNMAFISSAKHSSENEDGNTACVPTASASVATISQDTACAYIASQSSSSQIKFEDINQIDKDDMEEMDIKWSMALLSMRADKFWKKIRKKISIKGSDMAGFDKSKDWSYMVNDEEDHALVADEVAPTKSALMANTSAESKVSDNSLCSKDCKKNNDSLNRLEFRTGSNNECIEILKKKLEILKKENEGVDGKLSGFLIASKDLDNLIESQRSDKNKDGLGYSAVPPPPAQIYSSPKKDLSWTGLSEFADDTVTDYSRPSPTMESTSSDDQNRNPSISETEASPSAITSKPFIKFVKTSDSPTESKIDKAEKAKKSPVKKRVKRGTSRYQDDTHKSLTPRPGDYRPYRPSQRPIRSNMNDARPNITSFNKKAHSYANRPFQRTSAVRSQYRALWVLTVNRNLQPVNKKNSTGSRNFPIANRKFTTASRKFSTGSTKCSTADMGMKGKAVKPSACNISYFSDYEPFDGGYVLLVKEDARLLAKELSKPNSVLFTDSECIVLERDFKLLDDANILLRTPRQHNMYSIDLNNIVPYRDLTCLVDKASADECMLWHMRLGNISYLSDFEPLDGGYVSFGQGGYKITGKGTIKIVNAGTISTNHSGIKDATNQEVRKNESSLRYILLPNWAHDALLETTSSKPYEESSTQVPKGSGNPNPTASTFNPSAEQIETLTMKSPIPTVSSLVLTACLNDSSETSSEARLVSKRVANQEETPSLDNILSLTNRFDVLLRVSTSSDEIIRVEVNVSNMETSISASPTPTLRIHKDHPKSQIIGHVDILI